MSLGNQLNHLTNQFWYQWRRNSWLFYAPRLFTDYEQILIDRPIFLVGNQGEGLTLLGRMLRRHELAVSISGNSKYWSGADELQGVMNLRLPESLAQKGKWFGHGIDHEVLTPPHSFSYASKELLPVYRKTADDASGKDAQKLKFLIKEAIHRFGRHPSESRFIDKSQTFTVKISFVNQLLQGCNPFFILLTRNPFASCIRAATGKAGDMKRYARSMSLEERLRICCEHWANSMRCATQDGTAIKNFMYLRFEDLLSDPESSLKQVCKFVGLEFFSDMVPAAEHKLPLGSRFRDRWYPMRTDVNDSYINNLTISQRDLINDYCGEQAKQFGYSAFVAKADLV